VITPDLPGHGDSPRPGRQSVSDYAADLVALLDALEIQRVVVAGHSMGGAIAQTLALDYADRVAGLILVATGAKLRVHPDILDQIKFDVEAVAALLMDWIWALELNEQTYNQSYQQILANEPEVLYGDYLACDNFDVRDRLGTIRVPTLIVSGTEDRMTPLKYGEFLREHIAASVHFTITGGGHMVALERPEIVSRTVAEWLQTTQA
jgi:pimeloyl-ACP methyl ester carboxylesterase